MRLTGVSKGLFAPFRAEIVWVTATLAGLGPSSLHLNLILYIVELMKVTGLISSLCVVCLYVSDMIGPLIVGNLSRSTATCELYTLQRYTT